MPSVLEVIENKDLDLNQTDYYAAILGESPSKGAKSPGLWNAAFKELNLPGMMHPMDIKPDRLGAVVQCLREDNRFIGGAVTMPYKVDIMLHLDDLDPEVKAIGAVNCIYRDEKKLIGSNSDGAGALWNLEKEMAEPLTGKTILLVGTGGAGFAVASFLASAVGDEGCIMLTNRTPESRDNLAKKLKGRCRIITVDWPLSPNDIIETEILVNCSSIGFETPKEDDKGAFCLKFFTPLGPVDNTARVEKGENVERRYLKASSNATGKNLTCSLEILASMDCPFVFDIIYQPRQTMLLYLADLLGYKTLNGAGMNLEQAVIAFESATVTAGLRGRNRNEVHDLMRSVW